MPARVPPENRVALCLRRIHEIRSEAHTATYASLVRDRLRETLDLIEFLISGQVTSSEPNTIAGSPPPADPNATRVQIIQNMPSPPVIRSDVTFAPGPGPGQTVGQGVEFYDGPGYPAQNQAGQRVEYFDGPQPQGAVTSPPAGHQMPYAQPTHVVEAGSLPAAPNPPMGGPEFQPVAPVAPEKTRLPIPLLE